MTLLLIIIATVFTLVAAYNVVTPFLSSQRDQLRFELLDEDLRRVEDLASQRALLLQELRDITLDRETGKISKENYEELKHTYERQALEVMRELDELHGGRGWEEAIDEELDRRLARLEAERDDQHSQQDAERGDHKGSQPDDFITCPKCSKHLEPEARFCSRCGTNLVADDEEPAESKAAPVESRAIPNSGSEVAT